jgi:diguanylate cyclase (GGDEF)-like protein
LIFSQTSYEDALRLAERIEHAVSGLAVSRFALLITLSIGLTFVRPGETEVSMLAPADMALYNAKWAGRNCTRVLLASVDDAPEHSVHVHISDAISS